MMKMKFPGLTNGTGLLHCRTALYFFLTALILPVLAYFPAGCFLAGSADNTEPYIESIHVSANADSVMQGKTLQLLVDVAAKNGASEGVVWSIASSGHDPGTSITDFGLLKVALAEPAAHITVRATSAADEFSDIYGELEVAVEAAPGFAVAYGTFTGGDVSGPASAPVGAVVTLVITTTGDNVLQSLTVSADGGATIKINGSGSTRTFTMPQAAVTVTAVFSEPGAYFSKDFDTSLCSFYDKFEGTGLDRTKWDYQNGNGNNGWGNQEKEYYRAANVTVSGGILRIEARKETYSGCAYTSGKLVTATGTTTDGVTATGTHFSQTYGRFEAKIRMTNAVQGMWPAFWMMPLSSSPYGGWPKSGEIDIMEMRGRIPNVSSGTIHMAPSWGGDYYIGANQTFENGSDMTDWHVYGVLWTKTDITLLIDGKQFRQIPFSGLPTQSNSIYASSANGTPFDRDFFLILNLAVGGTFDGGLLPADSSMPVALEVEWVRAYAPDKDPWQIMGTVTGANYSN